MFGKKKKNNVNVKTEESSPSVKVEVENNDYEWIEGFKGTNENMQCNDYQYELNKKHVHNGEVAECVSGFHFCENLGNCFAYYDLFKGNRYFKVKALAQKKEARNYGNAGFLYFDPFGYREKRVSKEIILTEELAFEDLRSYVKDYCPFVETEEEYHKAQNNLKEFVNQKFATVMKGMGYHDRLISFLSSRSGYNKLWQKSEMAKMFNEEGLSKDMAVNLLLTHKDEK